MKIVKFRVVGLPGCPDTQWRPVGHGLTLLDFDSENLAADTLLALQSINPPYDIEEAHPFKAFPQYIKKGPTTKKVIPAKKTAAFVVFSKTLPLVRRLAAIDPELYALDRIEFGRRRDLSLWSNFVEIASSSRWSEVRPLIEELLPTDSDDRLSRHFTNLSEYCSTLKDTDRIKGETAVELDRLLIALEPHLKASQCEFLQQALLSVHRHDRFLDARQAMAQYLPLFLFLSSHHLKLYHFSLETIVSPAVINGRENPLTHLLSELYRNHPIDLTLFLELINSGIKNHLPGQEAIPQFVQNGNVLQLRLVSPEHTQEFNQLSPINGFILLIQTTIVLHQSLRKGKPVILLHPQGLAKSVEESCKLLKMLSKVFRKDQALLAPGQELLEAYRAGEAGKRVRSLGLD